MSILGERSQIERSLSPQKVIACGVVRVYRTTGQSWDYTGIVAVAVFSNDAMSKCSNITLLDLQNFSKLYEQEVYFNFKYDTPRASFHTFEAHDCVAGFSFADDEDANQFANAVNNNLPGQTPQVSQAPPPMSTPTPTPTPSISTSSQSIKHDEKKKTGGGGGGGFFSKLFGGKKEEEKEVEISGPTNFRHESHIGWDPVNGFDIKNIPPAWKKLFKEAGIKKSDLQNKDTAELVMKTVVENLPAPQAPPPMSNSSQPPPPPNRSAPPPIPSSSGGPPPPPNRSAPPPVPSSSGGPPPPPPPSNAPPPPVFNAPPPPSNAPPPPSNAPPPPSFDSSSAPPPSNAGGGGGGGGSLMEMIQKKQQSGLNKVDKPEALPALPEDTGGLANALANALKNRRGAIKEDERDSDEEASQDEWSD